jgi:hypothetical protein
MFQFSRGIALVAALMLNSGAVLAEADRSSADYMMPYCRQWIAPRVGPAKDDLGRGICYGIVATLVDVFLNHDFCIYGGARGPTNEQFIRVVVKYIDGRPERLKENFYILAHEGLQATWPCKK